MNDIIKRAIIEELQEKFGTIRKFSEKYGFTPREFYDFLNKCDTKEIDYDKWKNARFNGEFD